MSQDHVGLQRDQLFRECLRIGAGGCEANLDVDIAAFRPPELLDVRPEFFKPRLGFRTVLGEAHQDRNAPHPLGLLRAPGERPRDCRTN